MGKKLGWSFGIAVTLAGLLFSLPASADTTITLTAASGTNLSDVHVGDILNFDVMAGTTDTVEENFTSLPDIHVFWDIFADGTMNLLSFTYAPGVSSDLRTDPIIATLSFQATGAGEDGLFIGWPDCTGLPSDTTGCAITNLGATRPADSDHLDFLIQPTPEPSSITLLAAGLLGLGLMAFLRR
jgi:hypothetical protein